MPVPDGPLPPEGWRPRKLAVDELGEPGLGKQLFQLILRHEPYGERRAHIPAVAGRGDDSAVVEGGFFDGADDIEHRYGIGGSGQAEAAAQPPVGDEELAGDELLSHLAQELVWDVLALGHFCGGNPFAVVAPYLQHEPDGVVCFTS